MIKQRQYTCPECLCRFPLDDLRWIDDSGTEVSDLPLRLPRRERTWRWMSGQLPGGEDVKQFRRPQSEAEAAEMLERGFAPYCPAGHELPQDFHNRETVVIGLVGERAGGKSHYIAVLVNQLINGSSLVPYDLVAELAPSCQGYYMNTYWRWLYGGAAAGPPPPTVPPGVPPRVDLRPRPVPLTPPVGNQETAPPRKPVVLVLRHTTTGRSVNVVLYDASGEQMATAQGQARFNKFLLGADALFLFLSPWALPELRKLISPSGDVVGQDIMSSQLMFDSLASSIRAVRHIQDDADVTDLDTLVLLAKADQVQHVDGFDSDWLKDLDGASLGVKGVLRRRAEETGPISEFLVRHGAGNLVSKLSLRFPDAGYAALTTTGCSVDSTGHYDSVSPARVVEPLLEILYRRGLVGDGRADD